MSEVSKPRESKKLDLRGLIKCDKLRLCLNFFSIIPPYENKRATNHQKFWTHC